MNFSPEVNNGAFTGLTDSNFAPWTTLSTGTPQFRTNNASPNSGSTNFVLTSDRQIGYDLGHQIATGDTFNLSFGWRDAANWDATDTMDMTLFYTADDDISSSPVTLINLNSGNRTGTGTWETASISGASFSDPAAAGKKLFVRLSATNVTQGEFARVDDIFVEVEPVPEPSTTALLGLGGLALVFRRRK